MNISYQHSVPSKPQILWRGMRGRCPKCNEGKILKTYIKQVDTCAHCGEDIGTLRAEDGPAWLSIFLTTHIIAPLIGYFALHDTFPQWFAMVSLITLTVGLSLILLPRTKGLFIAALWLTSKKKAHNENL